MIIRDMKILNRVHEAFEQAEMKRTGKKQWITVGFYIAYDRWLKEEHNCVYRSDGFFEFTNEKDAIVFILRWS